MPEFTGDENDNVIDGTTGDDVISGLGGADTLSGLAGDDVLEGGDGNDTLIGGGGDDHLDGGDGDDTLILAPAADTVATMIGGAGDDTFKFQGLFPTGSVTLDGGAGADSLVVGEAPQGGIVQIWGMTFTGFETFDGGNAAIYANAGQLEASFSVITALKSLLITTAGTTDLTGVLASGVSGVITGFDGGDDVISVSDADAAWSISGGGGNDAITGGLGDDTLSGGDGDDALDGGDGDDTLNGGDGDNVLNGGAGHDQLNTGFETSSTDTLNGGDGDDVVNVQSFGVATVDAGAGDDQIYLSSGGDHVVDGGAGLDTIFVGANVSFASAVNVETLDASGNAFSAAAGALNGFTSILNVSAITLTTAGATDLGGKIASGDNGVVIGVDDGADIIDITGADTGWLLMGGGGDDQLTGGSGGDTLDGGAGADTLFGQAGDDILAGGAGGDLLQGGGGADTADYAASTGGVIVRLFNGTGVGGDAEGDTLVSVARIVGSNFNDVLVGASFSEQVLEGGAGNDLLSGYSGNDTLRGDAGDDLLIGGAGGDHLDGGDGVDAASYADSSAGVIVRLFNGTGANGFADGDVLSNIEQLTGSAFNDILVGASGSGEVLDGGGGNDILSGYSGNDMLTGGLGADVLDGGLGFDTANYAASAGGVVIRLFNGTGQGGSAHGDALMGIERIVGSDFNDVLIGASGAQDSLEGRTGNDILSGYSGNDMLVGGAGDDVLIGGVGADALDGGGGFDTAGYADSAAGVVVRLFNGTGAGGSAHGDALTGIERVVGSSFNDVLVGASGVADNLEGGEGNDILSGYSGADTLRGGAGDDVLIGGLGDDAFIFVLGDGIDTITDFLVGASTDDVIGLSGLGAAFDTFAEVMAAASQVVDDVLFDFGGGDQILVQNADVSDFDEDDFMFA